MWNRISPTWFVLALAVLSTGPFVPQVAAAQATGSIDISQDNRPGFASGEGELSPEVMARVFRGDQLILDRRYRAAAKEYRSAAEKARMEGHLPTLSLRRLAHAYYFQGDYRRAATILDRLARDASTFGALSAEAWALADAAWLYGKYGARRQVEQRIVRLQKLLSSPYLPEEIKSQIALVRLNSSPSLALDEPPGTPANDEKQR